MLTRLPRSFSPLQVQRTVFRQSSAGWRGLAAGIEPSKIEVTKTSNPKPKSPKESLVFGREFSDHMLTIQWTKADGWHAPKIQPYGPLHLDPSSIVFHYALECFEGMKAYKDAEGKVRLFRPMDNMRRFDHSSRRMAMPGFEHEKLLDCIKELVKVDHDWIPRGKGYSLYIRPTMIGTQDSLGVGPTDKALCFVILSPVGPYYPEGFKPVSLYADSKNVRAWVGGTGDSKCGGNYGPTIVPQIEAAKKGYAQILWLYGDKITEVGTMNMFIYWINEQGEKELITAELDGTILPGVTRRSILELTRDWNEFKVTERTVTMTEFLKALSEGRVLEAFGAGTAAIVSPIQRINHKDVDYDIPMDKNNPDAQAGPLTARISEEIMAIQYGEKAFRDWSVVVDLD